MMPTNYWSHGLSERAGVWSIHLQGYKPGGHDAHVRAWVAARCQSVADLPGFMTR